jgi:hypothetical protein
VWDPEDWIVLNNLPNVVKHQLHLTEVIHRICERQGFGIDASSKPNSLRAAGDFRELGIK